MKKLFSFVLLLGITSINAQKMIPLHNQSKAYCVVSVDNGIEFFIKPNSTEKVQAGKLITIKPYKKDSKKILSTKIRSSQSTTKKIVISNGYAIPDTMYHTGLWYTIAAHTE